MKILIDPFCKICGRELGYGNLFRGICDGCFSSIPKIDVDKSCSKCGFPNGKSFCLFCSNNKLDVDRNVSLFEYRGFVRDLIYEIKFYSNPKGIDILKELVSDVVLDTLFDDEIDFVVPVPTSIKSLFERGFDLVHIVTKYLAKMNSKRFLKVVKKKIFSRSQKNLSREERIKLSKTQFFVSRRVRLEGKVVLLVDDVFTTGSTINVCSSLLRSLGARKVYSLTIVRSLEDF